MNDLIICSVFSWRDFIKKSVVTSVEEVPVCSPASGCFDPSGGAVSIIMGGAGVSEVADFPVSLRQGCGSVRGGAPVAAGCPPCNWSMPEPVSRDWVRFGCGVLFMLSLPFFRMGDAEAAISSGDVMGSLLLFLPAQSVASLDGGVTMNSSEEERGLVSWKEVGRHPGRLVEAWSRITLCLYRPALSVLVSAGRGQGQRHPV